MIIKKSVILIGILSLLTVLSNCDLNDMFDQPKVSVLGFTLKALPTDTTKLDVRVTVKNVDSHDADVYKVTYTATIEGVKSSQMTYTKDFSIDSGKSKDLTLPLTLPTEGAIDLLAKLTEGKLLNYKVTGTFDADTPIGKKTLKLDVSGSAKLDAGVDDYYKQPSIEVEKIVLKSVGLTTTTAEVYITVTNESDYSATISAVDYKAVIQGVSTAQNGTYTDVFTIGPGESKDIVLEMTLSSIDAAALALQGTATYTVTGAFTAKADLGNGEFEFRLPLNVSGSTSIINKTDLGSAIDTATGVLDGASSLIGSVISTSDADTFQTAIDAATTTYNDDSADQGTVDGATSSLTGATSDFQNLIPTF